MAAAGREGVKEKGTGLIEALALLFDQEESSTYR